MLADGELSINPGILSSILQLCCPMTSRLMESFLRRESEFTPSYGIRSVAAMAIDTAVFIYRSGTN